MTTMRAALYSRVSTEEQTLANQQLALRAHAVARGWEAVEFSDIISGARDKRVGLDSLLAAVRRRHVDVVAIVRLDRLARSVHHLVTLAKEFQSLGVELVVLDQAIDTTTPTGRLMFHVLSAIAEFERDLIRDRVRTGMRRVKHQGTKSGRPVGRPRVLLSRAEVIKLAGDGASLREIAARLGVSPSTVSRAKAAASKG